MLLGFRIRKKVKIKANKTPKLDRYDLEVAAIQHAENWELVRLFYRVIFGVQANEKHCVQPQENSVLSCSLHQVVQYSTHFT